ncbi:unnamed protein product [Adineta steineri]|uniref:Uncharacterized protein n=1 Tax=Adineta steineri TaxID=433720 RepID=A0A818WJW8_9BILA|nr:unnamed protein product [Adineta steineri]
MDPLNNMYDALVSINNILQKSKYTNKDICMESTAVEKIDNTKELSLDSKSTATVHQTNYNQLHYESLTQDNFYRAHLCNRNIDELPNISVDDIKQLKLINIYTMQDLLGRFLIHDTPEDFYIFLLNTFHLNEKTATIITDLFHQWTKYNLDAVVHNTDIDTIKPIH